MRRWVAALVCAVVLSACRVDATVTVAMRHNGSGVVKVAVVLDRAAVQAAEVGNGKLEQRVRVDDLPAAGWQVSRWKRDTTGGATLVVRKAFHRPAEVAGIVREISGSHGPFRSFTASRSASTFSTHWRIAGVVDGRGLGAGVADDPQLLANLTGERVDIPQIEARLDEQLKDLHLHAVTVLPHDGRRDVSAVAGRRTVVVAKADDTNFNRVGMVVLGVGAGILALLLLVLGERRSRQRQLRRSRGRSLRSES